MRQQNKTGDWKTHGRIRITGTILLMLGVLLSQGYAQEKQPSAAINRWGYSAWIGSLTAMLQLKGNVVASSEIVSAGKFELSEAVIRVFKSPTVKGEIASPKDTDFFIPMLPTGSGTTVARIRLVEYPDLLKEGSKIKNGFVTPSQLMVGVRSSRKESPEGGIGTWYTNWTLLSGQGHKAEVLVLTAVEGWGEGFRDAWSLGERDDNVSCTWFMPSAEHIIVGKVRVGDFVFESDLEYPLVFKFVKDIGYVYLCGRGTVTSSKGVIVRVGHEQNADTWIALINHREQLKREGAVQALGWLAKGKNEKDKAIPVLIKALRDSAYEVRRDAAESLGRIGDDRAIEPLTRLADGKFEKDEWVRKVASEAIQRIMKK